MTPLTAQNKLFFTRLGLGELYKRTNDGLRPTEDGQPRCAVASGSPPGLYNLYVRHTDGRTKKLTGYAMTHHECCVMKSKLSEWTQARTLLVKETK